MDDKHRDEHDHNHERGPAQRHKVFAGENFLDGIIEEEVQQGENGEEVQQR